MEDFSELENKILKKAIVEFQMAREIAQLFDEENELRAAAIETCVKIVTILKYLTEFSLYANQFDNKGIYRDILDGFREDTRANYFVNAYPPTITNGDMNRLICQQIFYVIIGHQKSFSLLSQFDVDSKKIDDETEGQRYRRELCATVITHLVSKFDQSSPIAVVKSPTAKEIGELFSIFSDIFGRIQKNVLHKSRMKWDIDSLPAGIKQLYEMGKTFPEIEAAKTFYSWKSFAFNNESRVRKEAGPSDKEYMYRNRKILTELFKRFGISDNTKRGMRIFNLSYTSTIYRINEMFGLVHGADISGSVQNYVFVIDKMFSAEFELTESIVLSRLTHYSDEALKKTYRYNPYLIFTCFATLVAEFHHTVLEVALALSMSWSDTFEIKYAPGIYTSLNPLYFVDDLPASKNWIIQLQNILNTAQVNVDNQLMLIDTKGITTIFTNPDQFYNEFAFTEYFYRQFSPMRLIDLGHNILFGELSAKYNDDFEGNHWRRGREAFAQEKKSRYEQWARRYPNASKAMESGDPDSYWYNLEWRDISLEEQQQWELLGWNANNYDANFPTPSSVFKPWATLNNLEASAVEILGYSELTWRGVKIAINNAEYGLLDSSRKANVTLRLQSAINADIPLIVDNYLTGIDPAEWKIKHLSVKYTLKNGEIRTKTVEEYQELILD